MNTIERLRELEAKAAPGAWEIKGDRYLSVHNLHALAIAIPHPKGEWETIFVNRVCTTEAELISEMRNALPKLLAVVEAAITEVEYGRGSFELEKALAALDE